MLGSTECLDFGININQYTFKMVWCKFHTIFFFIDIKFLLYFFICLCYTTIRNGNRSKGI